MKNLLSSTIKRQDNSLYNAVRRPSSSNGFANEEKRVFRKRIVISCDKQNFSPSPSIDRSIKQKRKGYNRHTIMLGSNLPSSCGGVAPRGNRALCPRPKWWSSLGCCSTTIRTRCKGSVVGCARNGPKSATGSRWWAPPRRWEGGSGCRYATKPRCCYCCSMCRRLLASRPPCRHLRLLDLPRNLLENSRGSFLIKLIIAPLHSSVSLLNACLI